MKKLFDTADEYLRQSDWKDMAMLKFCLAAMGVLIGTIIPKKHKEAAQVFAWSIFVATYIPLMAKFFRILLPAPAEADEA